MVRTAVLGARICHLRMSRMYCLCACVWCMFSKWPQTFIGCKENAVWRWNCQSCLLEAHTLLGDTLTEMQYTPLGVAAVLTVIFSSLDRAPHAWGGRSLGGYIVWITFQLSQLQPGLRLDTAPKLGPFNFFLFVCLSLFFSFFLSHIKLSTEASETGCRWNHVALVAVVWGEGP